ncbi:MAG: alpha-ketoglutarate-dependent dioxygenase AlkB [Myxococcota bacterium]
MSLLSLPRLLFEDTRPEASVLVDTLPEAVPADFEALWALHPADFHQIRMMGRLVHTPRWQQAYGRDYRYTGSLNRALPVPPLLEPWLELARTFEPGANSLLVNWYDGALGHYIGRHRDAPHGRLPGTNVVTISFGAARTFRFRPWKGIGHVDIDTSAWPIVVFGWEVNERYTHEVLRGEGQRISITARAFSAEGPG